MPMTDTQTLRARLHEVAPHRPIAPFIRLVMTLGPLVGFGLILAGAALWRGAKAAWFMAAVAGGSFVLVGKFVILAGVENHAPVGAWVLVPLVVYVETATAVILIANFMLFYRIPILGKRLDAIQTATWNVLHAQKWMRRFTLVGTIVFVAAPFAGSGAVGGAILGRLLGLTRASTLVATVVGSAIGTALVALGAALARDELNALMKSPVLTVGAFVLVLALLAVIGRALRKGSGAPTSP